jgi:hypothetical protein
MSISLNESDVKDLIAFLSEWRTVDEILRNEHFLNLARHMYLDEDSTKKAADHFNWISVVALPEPAVLQWVHSAHMGK